MKKRYSEEQIIRAIKEHEAGAKVGDLCRQLGISSDTFYNWRSKYAGMEVNEAKRLRVEQWQRHYNDERPHSALNDLPPAIYEKQVA